MEKSIIPEIGKLTRKPIKIAAAIRASRSLAMSTFLSETTAAIGGAKKIKTKTQKKKTGLCPRCAASCSKAIVSNISSNPPIDPMIAAIIIFAL
ncbi:MAG: hypothetical protein AAGJ87_04955 [Pseudomonadota bacterium]